MKKILFLGTLFIGIMCWGQNGIVGNFNNDWSNPAFFSTSDSGSLIYIGTGRNTDTYFRLRNVNIGGAGNNYEFGPINDSQDNCNSSARNISSNIGTISANTTGRQGCTTHAFLINANNASHNYVIKTSGTHQTDWHRSFLLFHIQGSLQTISSVSVPSGVEPTTSPTITATMSGIFNTGQAAYLRYTTNNWSSSTVIKMTYSSGNNYSASIPTQSNNTTVNYYVYTSGDGTVGGANGPASNGSDSPLRTININNNGSANYQYIVQNKEITASKIGLNFKGTTTWRFTGAQDSCDAGTSTINNINLGTILNTETFTIVGANLIATSGASAAKLFYRIYKTGDTPSGFTEYNLNTETNCGINRKFETISTVTLPISSLVTGEYNLEIYHQATHSGNPIYMNNSGNNYIAKFIVLVPTPSGNIDSNDGNFNPSTDSSGIYESYVGVRVLDANGTPISGFNRVFDMDGAIGSTNSTNYDMGTHSPGAQLSVGTEAKIFVKGNHKECGCSSWYYLYKEGTAVPVASDFPLPTNGTLFNNQINGKFTLINLSENISGNTPFTKSVDGAASSTHDTNYNNSIDNNNGTIKNFRYKDYTDNSGIISSINTPVNSILCPTCSGDTFRVALALLSWVSTTNDCSNTSSLIYHRDINQNKITAAGVVLNPHHPNAPSTNPPGSPNKNSLSGTNLFYTFKIAIAATGGNTTFTSGVWSNGTPDRTKNAVLNSDYVTTSSNTFTCNDLTIADGVSLTISDETFIEVLNNINTNSTGKIIVNNKGNLVQRCDDKAPSARIEFKKTTRNLKAYDYSYFGVPITGNIANQLTAANGGNGDYDWMFRWNSNGAASAWASITTSTPGQGFIARRKNLGSLSNPNPTVANATPFNLQWNGTANNGKVTYTATAHATTPTLDIDANKILIGNPYPSAIDAAKFINHSENQELEGTLYFWTAATAISNQTAGAYGYNYSPNDYATWNVTGGTGTAASTLAGFVPTGKIASGQGFFARIKASGTLEFTNEMRLTTDNTQFFRIVTENNTENNTNNPKVWLNLSSTDNPTFRQILVGYVPNATNNYEGRYDAESQTTSNNDFYSVIDHKKLNIQGKSLPFNYQDTVALGLKIQNSGNYFITLDRTEGILSHNDLPIYIYDNLTNTEHNIKNSPYGFNVSNGIINDRFVLKYQSTLSNNLEDLLAQDVWIVSQNNINIQSKNEKIKAIEIYDLVGRKIFSSNEFDSKEVILNQIIKNNQVLIAKIKLENQTIINQKFIF